MPQLLKLSTRSSVEATILPNLSVEVIQAIDKEWIGFQDRRVSQLRKEGHSTETLPEHLHWQWANKARYYQNRGGTDSQYHGLRYFELEAEGTQR